MAVYFTDKINNLVSQKVGYQNLEIKKIINKINTLINVLFILQIIKYF